MIIIGSVKVYISKLYEGFLCPFVCVEISHNNLFLFLSLKDENKLYVCVKTVDRINPIVDTIPFIQSQHLEL